MKTENPGTTKYQNYHPQIITSTTGEDSTNRYPNITETGNMDEPQIEEDTDKYYRKDTKDHPRNLWNLYFHPGTSEYSRGSGVSLEHVFLQSEKQ